MDSSKAFSHAFDLQKLVDDPAFQNVLLTGYGVVKPVVIVTSDGGPDENPRYQKVTNARSFYYYTL